MTKSLFVTGGSGYLGKRLLEVVDLDRFRRVVVLQRQGSIGLQRGLEVVEGDLLHPASYQGSIDDDMTIVHLAALTGKGRRADHMRVNFQGTKELLAAATAKGATEFLFVSSIAAAFSDRPGYHYADAKEMGERAVQESEIAHLIVRPTMIFGPNAPVLDGLSKLACAPFVPVFGGGSHMCQPVHVDDMAQWLIFALQEIPFDGQTLAVGGPTKITMRNLLQRIRHHETGKDGGLVTMPLSLIRSCLRILERPFHSFLPLTAGQLASFANDSVAATLSQSLGGHIISRSLSDMIGD